MSTNDSPRNTLFPEPPPHPSKFAKTKQTWLIIGITTLFCVLIIALLFASSDRIPQQVDTKSADVAALLDAPSDTITNIAEATSSEIGVILREGGWIQQTDSFGNLTQQYRCTALDPAPQNMAKGWIEMTDPDVELFLSDDQILRITGDTAIANAPNRTLESGDIYGNVQLELFEGNQIDTQRDTPTIVMTTPQASFDNFLGEVLCESEIRVLAANGSSLIGRQLAIRFNDANGRIEYLRLEEVDSITLYQEEQVASAKPNSETRSLKSKSPTHRTPRVSAGAISNNEQYYLLTLDRNVHIAQGDLFTGKEGYGDTMTIAFALEATQSSVHTQPLNYPLQPNAMLLAAVLGSTLEPTAPVSDTIRMPEPHQEPVTITCDGGLTMLPLDDIAALPSLPEETRLELHGKPALLIDHEATLSARGQRIRYEVNQERVDLFGDAQTYATVSMKNSTTSARHVWLAQKSGVGKIVGEGTLVESPDQGVKTTINWSGGVDFSMTPMDEEGQGGVLQQVICKENIVLSTDESTLTCDLLDVRFTPDPDASGASSPNLAIATGNVKGMSESQTLWADQAELTFLNTEQSDTTTDTEFGSAVQADTMTATGDVQVLLDDGGRAFCNTLRGDINQSVAELEGDVVVAYKRMLMDRGDTALFRINRTTGKGLWEGPGQARFLTLPIDVQDDKRIDRPVIEIDTERTIEDESAQHVSMKATWQDSMAIDQHFNDDAGLVDFRGTVVARSQQSPVELTEVQSDSLQFEFTKVQDNALGETPSSETNDTENPDTDTRQLQKIIARENATFEHRLWNQDAPEELPVVYFIGGNHIEYETDNAELLAVGDGTLVIRDNRAPLKTTHQSSLAGRGTTKFTWDGHLRTTKLTDTLYRITMQEHVEMAHRGLDGQVGMLTADSMKAISQNTSEEEPTDQSTLALRGMDVQELQASGDVYVSTTTRRVDCDVFDYNLMTGLAKLSATNGRTVAIVTAGTPYPVRAKSILWNMDPGIDSIEIKGLQGNAVQ